MTKLGPYDLNTIVTGDARELAKAIPDESVDLIFTDPVYDRIDDYLWLAETAARVLKQNGALLCWASTKTQYAIMNAIESIIDYCWTFYITMHGRAARLMYYNIFTKTTPLLWFGNKNQIDG